MSLKKVCVVCSIYMRQPVLVVSLESETIKLEHLSMLPRTQKGCIKVFDVCELLNS